MTNVFSFIIDNSSYIFRIRSLLIRTQIYSLRLSQSRWTFTKSVLNSLNLLKHDIRQLISHNRIQHSLVNKSQISLKLLIDVLKINKICTTATEFSVNRPILGWTYKVSHFEVWINLHIIVRVLILKQILRGASKFENYQPPEMKTTHTVRLKV